MLIPKIYLATWRHKRPRWVNALRSTTVSEVLQFGKEEHSAVKLEQVKGGFFLSVWFKLKSHYCDVIMGAMASQITSLTIVYSTCSSVYSGADQWKQQSSASLALVWGIHRSPVNSPHKWPVARKMFPFDDVIMVRIRIGKPIHLRYSPVENRVTHICVSELNHNWFR